jgi:hypothetical protein
MTFFTQSKYKFSFLFFFKKGLSLLTLKFEHGATADYRIRDKTLDIWTKYIILIEKKRKVSIP